MASGDTLAVFTPHSNEPPASGFAPLTTVNAALALAFSTGESAVFTGVMPHNYGGGNINAVITWASASTSGTCQWQIALERDNAGTSSTADSFGSAVAMAQAPAATASQYVVDGPTSVTAPTGLAAGNKYRAKVTRSATSDTMSGTGNFYTLELREV